MKETLNSGDVVYLKSGSLPMTVGEVKAGGVTCYWFSHTEKGTGVILGKETFPPATLEKDMRASNKGSSGGGCGCGGEGSGGGGCGCGGEGSGGGGCGCGGEGSGEGGCGCGGKGSGEGGCGCGGEGSSEGGCGCGGDGDSGKSCGCAS